MIGSNNENLAHPKGPTQRDERKAKKIVLESKDRLENRKVKKRSGGRCEAVLDGVRCQERSAHVHHLLGGIGVRARGDSALATHKVDLCVNCHFLVHRHAILVTWTTKNPQDSLKFENAI